MCNTNKTPSKVSGDKILKNETETNTFFSIFTVSQRRGGFFLSSSIVPETYKYLSCLELFNTYNFIEVKSIMNVSNNEVVESGCMCYRLSLK